MNDFSPGRQQDASPTIRGFHYQIQQTLDRWLDLQDNEVLILECGEDIDKTLRADSPEKARRVLEQVKALGHNLTLQSASAVESVANFACHLAANPEVSLQFRFTTTASPGRENLSPFPVGVKALEVWEHLRKLETRTKEDDVSFDNLSKILARLKRPSKYDVEAWAKWEEIVQGRGVTSLDNFIRSFEWCCGQDEYVDLRNKLILRLQSFVNEDEISASIRYDQILAHLIFLLSKDGEKIVTRENLVDILNQPTLVQADRKRLDFLENITKSHSNDLESVKKDIKQLSNYMDLQPLVFGDVAVDIKSINPIQVLASPPPFVSKLARRTETVLDLLRELSAPSWLAIHGDYGVGKTHLALLICEQANGFALGISMLGLDHQAAGRSLLFLLNQGHVLSSLSQTGDGVILIDNIPEMPPGSILEEALLALTAIINKSGRILISTSRYQLPSSLINRLPLTFNPRQSPPFSDRDAEELFKAHKAVTPLLYESNRVAVLNGMCSGHPVLLTALARFLAQNKVEPEKALLGAMVGEHRTEIDLETTRVVLHTVESSECRQLLYRLASAGIPLSHEEIRVVASAKPELAEPTSCIARLDGLWLRGASKNRFEVSPLVVPLGKELKAEVGKSVHLHVAFLILNRGKISPSEFMRAITSFLLAGQENSAAAALIQGYIRAPAKRVGYDAIGILLFFPADKPNSLSQASELPLRAAQAVTAAITEVDASSFIDRINSIVSEESNTLALGAILAGSILITSTLEIPASLSILGASLIERFQNSNDVPQQVLEQWSEEHDGKHILLASASIQTWNELAEFIELLASVPSVRIKELLDRTEFIEAAPLTVCRPLFNKDLGINPGSFERLPIIENRCFELGLMRFAVEAAIAKLIIIGEYKKDTRGMLIEGRRALERYKEHSYAVGKVTVMMGQQLCLAKETVDGLEMIVKGLEVPGAIIGPERANRLVDAINAAWELSLDPSSFTDELESVLRDTQSTNDEYLCPFHAQIAVVRWKYGSRLTAFKHYSYAVNHLAQSPNSTRSARFGASLAHCLTYSRSIAASGKPPLEARDGGPFAEPEPRMFSGLNLEAAKSWKPRQGLPIMRWFLGDLAEELGLHEESAKWLDSALLSGLEAKSPLLLSILTPRSVLYSVRTAEWANALEMAVVHGRARVFTDQFSMENGDILGDQVEFEPLSPLSSSKQENEANKHGLWLLLPVLASEIAIQFSVHKNFDAIADDLLDAIRLAANVSSSDEAWPAIIEAIELLGAESVTNAEYRDALNTFNGEEGSGPVQFFAHALLAMRPDAMLGQAAISQLSVLQHLEPNQKLVGDSADKYMQAVVAFWESAFESQRFRFNTPQYMKHVLADAKAKPLALRVRLILSNVLSSLSLRVPDETRKWLKNTGQNEII